MIINEDNQNKSVAGYSSKELVREMLSSLNEVSKHVNITVGANKKVGYPNQFKMFNMDDEIIFNNKNGEKWLVKTTSSVRGDRVRGNEWFAQNIREIDPTVTNIFLVVPDSIEDHEFVNIKKHSKKIQNPSYTSFITDVVTVYELKWLILEHALSDISKHIVSNILGKLAENDTISLLNEEKNKDLWNDYKRFRASMKTQSFRRFKVIMEKIGFEMDKDTIFHINAEKYTERLNNGGNPKTDVIFTVNSTKGIEKHTISIKNTNQRVVTVHEGSISDVIIALGVEDTSLAEALIHFQEIGSDRYLKTTYPSSWDVIDKTLHQYTEQLIELFFFGKNSPLVTNQDQIPDIILYNQKFNVLMYDTFIDYYTAQFKNRGQFNTPFQWTYPSGNRGKKIQIKGFTNN